MQRGAAPYLENTVAWNPPPRDSDLTALGYGLSIRGVLKLSL